MTFSAVNKVPENRDRRGRASASRLRLPREFAAVAVSIAIVLLSAAPAWPAVSAQQRGAALLAQLQNGQTSCTKLSANSFALMGEYSMGRIMGSPTAQNAMNAQMLATSGAAGEQLAYRFMGERLGGCATGNGPVAFGTMMGIMGTSQMGASYGSAYPANGYRSMMGGYGVNQTAGDGGVSVAAMIAIILSALLLITLIALLALRRPTRSRTQRGAA